LKIKFESRAEKKEKKEYIKIIIKNNIKIPRDNIKYIFFFLLKIVKKVNYCFRK
jgi:hypothetical protein